MSKFTEYIGSQFGNPRGFVGSVCCLIMNTINKKMYRKTVELMQQSGLTHIIARFLMPVLRPLFGKASEDSEAMQAVSANVTANLLGLSNAATPLGLRAASRLHKLSGSDTASDAVLTLIVLNSASIQLVPSTVAAVRAACGAQEPFDIMLPVWGASVVSVATALLLCRAGRAVFPSEKAAYQK